MHHEVSVLSLVDPAEDSSSSIAATTSYCKDLVTVSDSRRNATGVAKRLLQVGACVSPWSYERIVHRVPAMQRALDELFARERYDVVQFEFCHMGGYRVGARNGASPVICLDEHNIEYEILRRTASTASTTLRRAYNAVDWRKVRAEERRAWARSDGCALTSSRDEEMLLADAPMTRTAVVPNGVDLDFFRPDPGAPHPDPATFLFFGAIDYYPNTDGVLFFLREVMPRVAARLPDAHVCIVGRRPPAEIVAYESPHVQITGQVEDLRPWLARATAVVVPLRIGGGTRLKILEAMAMGKAIVSTSLGAEGLDVTHGADVLIADSAEDLAAQMCRLIAEPELGVALGMAARHLVSARYGWKSSVARLSALHEELLERRARR